MAPHEPPRVSVIIPVHHDWDRLRVCVDALEKQTYPGHLYEVIVINNDPRDPLPSEPFPERVRMLEEEKPGSYAARNRGILSSSADVLCFTDSDCIPAPDWIESCVKALQAGNGRVAGRVELFFSGAKLSPAEIFEKATAFPQEEYAAKGLSVTANMATWRKSFEEAGLFDDRLSSGGDIEWSRRALAFNIGIGYEAGAVVLHPARKTLRELFAKKKRTSSSVAEITSGGIRVRLVKCLAGFIPPVSAFRKYRMEKRMDFHESLTAAGVKYGLQIHGAFCKLYYTLKSKTKEGSS